MVPSARGLYIQYKCYNSYLVILHSFAVAHQLMPPGFTTMNDTCVERVPVARHVKYGKVTHGLWSALVHNIIPGCGMWLGEKLKVWFAECLT